MEFSLGIFYTEFVWVEVNHPGWGLHPFSTYRNGLSFTSCCIYHGYSRVL